MALMRIDESDWGSYWSAMLLVVTPTLRRCFNALRVLDMFPDRVTTVETRITRSVKAMAP